MRNAIVSVLLFASVLTRASVAHAARTPAPVPDAVWDSLRVQQASGRWAASDSLAYAELVRLAHDGVADSLELSRLLLYRANAHYQRRLVTDGVSEDAIERSIAIRERHAKPGDPLLAWSEFWATRFYRELARPEAGLRHAEAAVRQDSLASPPDTLRIARDLMELAVEAHELHDDARARSEYERAIALSAARRGSSESDVVPLIAEYGQFLSDIGEFDAAREQLVRARTLAERITDPKSDRLEGVLSRLATLEERVGNLSESIELAQRSYEITRSQFAEDDLPTLMARVRVANRLGSIGDFASARERFREIVPAYSSHLGPTHPLVLTARLSAVEAALANHDTAGAADELRLLDSVVVARSGLASSNGLSVRILEAQLDRARGDSPAARARLEGAITAVWPLAATLAPHLVTALSVAATAITGPADREAAEAIFARGDRLRDSTSARFGPDWSGWLATRAAAEVRLGMRDEAWRDALAASRRARERLRYQVQALPDRRALQLAELLAGECRVLGRLARDGSPAQVALAWDEIVRWRGLVRTEVASRRLAASAASDTAVVAAHARWLAAQRALAQQVVSGAVAPGDPGSAARFEAGRRDAEDAERRFMRQLGGAPADSVSLAHVREHLSSGQALVGFVTSDIDSGGRTLGAFVVRAGDPAPRYVELGDEAALGEAIADWAARLAVPPPASLAAARDAERRCRALGAVVRARLWDPLLRALGPVSEVLVVPEGVAWDVAWLALPGPSGGYLADEPVGVRVLNAERDVLPPAAPRAGRGLLAVGGADFDHAADGAGSAPPAGARFASRHWPCESERFTALPPLPAARAEAEAIAARWSTSHARAGGGTAELLEGAQASEEAFKRDAPGREVIHVATHGIELRDTCATGSAVALRGVGGVESLDAPRRPRPAASGASPAGPRSAPRLSSARWLGHRVWIALAGANRPLAEARDENDGLLTAEEIATLDLRGTDWVVLSACHSGAGETWASEGQSGMRRAFHLAGTHAVIASNWAVADEATREWMLALYDARARGLSAGASVRAASRAALAKRRHDGRSTNPFYWAGFEATGD